MRRSILKTVLIFTSINLSAQTEVQETKLEMLTKRVNHFISNEYNLCAPVNNVMQTNEVIYSDNMFNGLNITDVRPTKDKIVIVGNFKFEFKSITKDTSDTYKIFKTGDGTVKMGHTVNNYQFKLVVKEVLGDYVIQEFYCPYSVEGKWMKVYPY
jgi:hypothetical protein